MKPRLLQLPADAFSPLALTAGNAGLGAWVRAAAWCVRHESDGAIPMDSALLVAKLETWQKLERRKLVLITADTLHLLGFLATNPSQAQLAERAAVKARAGSKGGRVAAARRAAPASFPPPPASSPEVLATGKPSPASTQEKPSISRVSEEMPAQVSFLAPEPVAPPPPKRSRVRKAKAPKVEPEKVPGYEEAVDVYFEAFKRARKTDKGPVFRSREGKAVKELLAALGANGEVGAVINRAFGDPYFAERGTILDLARDPAKYQGRGKVASLGSRQQ